MKQEQSGMSPEYRMGLLIIAIFLILFSVYKIGYGMGSMDGYSEGYSDAIDDMITELQKVINEKNNIQVINYNSPFTNESYGIGGVQE